MSIIKSIPVELSDIVKEANLIVEVECLEPFTEEVAIKSADPKVPAPPFKKKGFVFRIKGVLKNTENIKVPQTIRVPREEWRRFLSQHKERYADGPSKSYGVKEYETEVDSMKNADILFLHHFQDMFELEVRGAFESSAALEKITMLIAAKSKY
jgi:hypothetical protein